MLFSFLEPLQKDSKNMQYNFIIAKSIEKETFGSFPKALRIQENSALSTIPAFVSFL